VGDAEIMSTFPELSGTTYNALKASKFKYSSNESTALDGLKKMPIFQMKTTDGKLKEIKAKSENDVVKNDDGSYTFKDEDDDYYEIKLKMNKAVVYDQDDKPLGVIPDIKITRDNTKPPTNFSMDATSVTPVTSPDGSGRNYWRVAVQYEGKPELFYPYDKGGRKRNLQF